MKRLELKKKQGERRSYRVRSRINGTSSRPRLSVVISNKNVSAQLIDDTKSRTISSITTAGVKELAPKTMTEKAIWCGENIAKSAKTKKVKTATLDRGVRIYHGRVAALADAARKNGLEL